MNYWISVPRGIMFSKRISTEEKELWFTIQDNLNEAGYCPLSNSELAKKISMSQDTVNLRLQA